MSSFIVPVIKLGKIGKHPNADTLSITQAEGCPCIHRTGDLDPGELALYIPVDAVIKEDSQIGKKLSFLKFKNGKHRVRAMKLRGIFSMGLLVPLREIFSTLDAFIGVEYPERALGKDFALALGIEKYEEPETVVLGGERAPDPGYMPVYDMESYRKFAHVIPEGTEVVVTEKIHGCNARFIHDGTQLWVGSHRTWKKVGDDAADVWNRVARENDLAQKLSKFPMVGVYGEVYGQVQDLKYGAKTNQLFFRVFDIYDPPRAPIVREEGLEALPARPGGFRCWDQTVYFCSLVGLETVPVLYRGPLYPEAVEPLRNGPSTLCSLNIREGVVIKPVVEGWNQETGRTILKLVGEDYLLRKDGTEHH